MMISSAWTPVALLLSVASTALGAFNPNSNTNLAVYYGQNSYGATHTTDPANWQTNLAHYCQDDVIDVFPLAFLNVFFGSGGLPEINLANTCNNVDDPVFPGSELANCQFMAADIQACQAKGKIITLSMGGATGAASFTSDSQAESFADLIWNTFLGGSSSTRPFGSAVLDGIDLDIEGGGSSGFAAFVTRIRSHASGASKPYYITAAPQCPFPDGNLGAVLNAVAFDAVYVQFYNNFCGLTNFNNPNAWNYDQWDTWAKTQSPNPNVKVYIGAPASPTAAGSGYVDPATFASILQTTKAQFSSFGGAMLWDASQAYANGRYDQAVKNALLGGSSAPTTSRPTTTAPGTTTRPGTTTSVASNGNCAGVAAWSSSVAYVGGSQVTFNNHLWTSMWWTQADTPGGAAGVWTDNGACTTSKATLAPQVSAVSTAVSVTAHASSSVAASTATANTAKAASTAVSATAHASAAISSAASAASSSARVQPSIAVSNTTTDANTTVANASEASNATESGSRKASRFFKL